MAATSRPRGRGGRAGDPRIGDVPRRRRSGPTLGERVRIFFGIVLMLALIATFTGVGFVAYMLQETAKHLPNPDNLIDYTPGGITEIYATDKDSATGTYVVLGRVFSQNKQFIPITQIPKILQNATVAIEDERFYSHPGIDVQGIARALYKDLRSKRVEEGGSTLTQQLARNVYLTQKRTASRKIKEMMLALQIEKNYSKEQILEMYLNEVGYGGNNYGVKAAAETYFGKQPKDLTLAEAALIAGLPQSPNGYYPYKHLKAAVERRNTVLAKMAELGYVTPPQAKAAQNEKVHLVPYKEQIKTDFKAPGFTNYVLRQLIAKYGKTQVYSGGLKVYTTLNWQMQQAATKALASGVQDFKDQGVTQGALVCIEPRTGYIRAMVGSVDDKQVDYNFAVQGGRQPGSSFKAFVYTTAFDMHPNRFGPDEDVDDADRSYHGYKPGNDGGAYHGMVRARNAFAYSYNAAAVWLANEIGVKNVIDYAHRLGITSRMEPNLSLALGAYDMSPLEMCSAYSTFANHGSHAHPMAIRAVLDADGVVLEDNAPVVDQQVIKESTTAMMSDMMGDVVDHGTAANAAGIHDVENARGKTGTTNDFRDAWFIGFTPELTTAVWVCGLHHVPDKHGHAVARYLPMKHVFGGVAAAPIWAAFMKTAVPIQRQAGEPPLPLPDKSAPKVAFGDSSDTSRDPGADAAASRPESPKSYSNVGYGGASSTRAASARSSSTPSSDASPSPSAAGNSDAAPAPPAAGDAPGASAAQRRVSAAPTSRADASGPSSSAAAGTAGLTAAVAPPSPSAARNVKTAASNVAAPASPDVTAAAPPVRRSRRGAAGDDSGSDGSAAAAAPVRERTVTVDLCADTGLLATRWCPETVTRTLPASEVPRTHCRKHRPMPGDG